MLVLIGSAPVIYVVFAVLQLDAALQRRLVMGPQPSFDRSWMRLEVTSCGLGTCLQALRWCFSLGLAVTLSEGWRAYYNTAEGAPPNRAGKAW